MLLYLCGFSDIINALFLGIYMKITDLLHRFTFENMPVRGEYVHLNESYQTIVNQHAYPEAVRRLLGEALAAAVLLSAIIKYDGRVTVQFRGEGKLKLLLAQCTNEMKIRGLVKCDEDLSYDELMASFQDGVLVIMLDSGVNKTRYQGIVAWKGNSLAESIENYFKESEQLATHLRLAASETEAVGFLLQIMPTQDRQAVEIEKHVLAPSWQHALSLTQHMSEHDLLTLTYVDLLNKLYPGETLRVYDPSSVAFQCTCSKQRSQEAVYLMGREEAEEEIKDKQVIVVTCDFCGKEYIYDRVDVANIFESKDNLPPDTHLH